MKMKTKTQMKTEQKIRLNKFIASCGIASRRKADELITAGKIRINGETVTQLGTRIDPATDRVEYNGKLLNETEEKIYVLINKPRNVISTVEDEFRRKKVTDFVKLDARLYPIGRLDYESTGALILTNDGEFTNKLTHPKFGIPKKYHVLLDRVIKPKDLYYFQKGVDLDGRKTAPCKAQEIRIYDNCSLLEVILHEGRNRQIRRMFEALGYEVQDLQRIEIGSVKLVGLKEGQWRHLSSEEVRQLEFEASEQDF